VSSKSQESNSSIKSQKKQLIQNGVEAENIWIEVRSAANEIKIKFDGGEFFMSKPKKCIMLTKEYNYGRFLWKFWNI
jgi:hypothetical protein